MLKTSSEWFLKPHPFTYINPFRHDQRQRAAQPAWPRLYMWVPSCSTNQDPFKRSGYSVTLFSKVGRCGWRLLPDVLAASCSAPGSQASVALFTVSERIGYVCALCFMCCFWLTACSRLKKPNTTNICLRWLLFRISDVKGSKINAKSRKSLSLALGMHVAVLD